MDLLPVTASSHGILSIPPGWKKTKTPVALSPLNFPALVVHVLTADGHPTGKEIRAQTPALGWRPLLMRNTLELQPWLQMAKSGGFGRVEGARAWGRGIGVCQQPGRAHRGLCGVLSPEDSRNWGHLSCCTFGAGTGYPGTGTRDTLWDALWDAVLPRGSLVPALSCLPSPVTPRGRL